MCPWEYTETELWRHGEGNVALYHVFGLTSFHHTVLAFAEARRGKGADAGETHDIVMRRSTDGGRTFAESAVLIHGEGRCLTNATPLYDAETGTAYLFYNINYDNIATDSFVLKSQDGGLSWCEPVCLTETLNRLAAPFKFHLFGPGHGIQLKGGAHGGRLLAPVWHRHSVTYPVETRGYCASLLYSDDHGASWQMAAMPTGADCRANETRLAQTKEGVLWSMRPASGPIHFESRSCDGGDTWTRPRPQPSGAANICDRGVVALSAGPGYENMVVISRPSRTDRRENMELIYSLDGGATYVGRFALPTGDAMPGYSDLMVLYEPCPVLGLIHCRYNHVLFSRISLQTLTSGAYDDTKRSVWL